MLATRKGKCQGDRKDDNGIQPRQINFYFHTILLDQNYPGGPAGAGNSVPFPDNFDSWGMAIRVGCF